MIVLLRHKQADTSPEQTTALFWVDRHGVFAEQQSRNPGEVNADIEGEPPEFLRIPAAELKIYDLQCFAIVP